MPSEVQPATVTQATACTRSLCVSLHDVAPATWSDCSRVLQAIREVGEVPVTLLVVPAHHGQCSARPDFEQEMSAQLAAGHELALHGYFHVDPNDPSDVVDWFRRRIYTAGEGEFCALSAAEASERLTLGRRWFEANGWPLTGFVAPAWLLGPGAWTALREASGLQYTSTLTKIITLPDLREIPAPCLTYSVRAAWRRPVSIAWNSILAMVAAASPVLRLGLHPRDAESTAIKRSWQRLLERALTDRRPLTKTQLVHSWRRQTAEHPRARQPRAGSSNLREQGLLHPR